MVEKLGLVVVFHFLVIIVLIIYGFWFGTVFVTRYPKEKSTDAYFARDISLRNTLFSSTLQLVVTTKSNEEVPIFNMLDNRQFIMTISFVQTGYTCRDVGVQVDR